MPLSGYLQDLSLLAGDCLLISPEKKTALIDNSPPGSKASCSPRLTAGTLNDMMLLDETAILYDGKAAHKADEKAESLQSPFTPPTLHIERTENKAYIFSPTTKHSPVWKRSSSIAHSKRKLSSLTSLGHGRFNSDAACR
jgi:hypothetical protein